LRKLSPEHRPWIPQPSLEERPWIPLTGEEVELIREKGLAWAEDVILSRLGLENTHYIGDYDLKQAMAAVNRQEG